MGDVIPTGRLSSREVERLHHALGDAPVTEELIVRFIGARWGARNPFYLSARVAAEAVRWPGHFIRAAKRYCEPELGF